MKIKNGITIDGNEAAAHVAFRANEVVIIYPITPSSPMGEFCDDWAAEGMKNIYGEVPFVQEMQSEAGAAGAVHGALQAGSLTTTFTASQGLLLMVPNMYKIAGELTSAVFHISARTVATHALSIFGDHSDVMALRQTGWGMMFGGSVQEVMDFALICQAATLESRIPFMNVFDGFRTSHEVMKIDKITDEQIKDMIKPETVLEHRKRRLNPENPFIRGTAQNPDVFFQARETVNPYYEKAPAIIEEVMKRFTKIVGREYNLFDYFGHPEAERIIIMMGSGAETAHETIEFLMNKGEKVGMIKVRVFRPFSAKHLMKALPSTLKSIAVLDRTKEPGSLGEPLYMEVASAITEEFAHGHTSFKTLPKIVGGRYGLSSKEFTPGMVKGLFDELKKADPKNHFTVGIQDDVSHTSIDYDEKFITENENVKRCIFWGIGADGTVSANKNSIKIIGEETDNFAQGNFFYDSKKSGGVTISHLRFGPDPIHSTYQIQEADFLAVHQFGYLRRYPVLDKIKQGGTFLLNSIYSLDQVWDNIPKKVQETIINKKLKFFVIDAYSLAKKINLGTRINTIMQTCFFALANILPKEEAIEKIKKFIVKTYGDRGDAVVKQNYAAVDSALENLFEVKYPQKITSSLDMIPVVPEHSPEFVKDVIGEIIIGRGDNLAVSKFPEDGTFPSATTQWEKRSIALDIPSWEKDLCIQCGRCILICPHAVIRAKIVEDADLKKAPETFKSAKAKWKEYENKNYILQCSPDDCTGCGLCVEICPVKDKTQPNKRAINLVNKESILANEQKNWDFFLQLPETADVYKLSLNLTKNIQLLRPLFEFSLACAGCGETPYLKLMSQLFGDRALIANATGCSSIYGGNLPTTPWAINHRGHGPSWNNSLFEDAAEFGMGMRLSLNKLEDNVKNILSLHKEKIDTTLIDEIIKADQSNHEKIDKQRERVENLKKVLSKKNLPLNKDELMQLIDVLVKKSVWVIGGDGWAYDIGFGGLDHVLASGVNINLLVLDTEVYSNTGGQSSKATQRSAVAKFAAQGKSLPKKDLGRMMMTYGNVYVAQIALGYNDAQSIKAFLEAEAYNGPSIIIAYAHCIAQGINMSKAVNQHKLAIDSGAWILYRYNPDLVKEGKNPLQLDSPKPKIPVEDYISTENRFRILKMTNPERAKMLGQLLQEEINQKWNLYEQLAKINYTVEK